jgi:hypothetical protein
VSMAELSNVIPSSHDTRHCRTMAAVLTIGTAVFLAPGLTGCGLIAAQQHAELEAQRKADEAICFQQFPVSPRHNNVAQARCIAEADRRYWNDEAAD